MRLLASLVAALGLASSVLARSATGDRILVVLDPALDKAEYSGFFESLQARGFQITFKAPKDESAVLQRFGVSTYDHLIMFAPSAKAFAPGLSPQAVLSAQSTHLNTLYILSPDISELQRDTLREYDIEFLERDSIVYDGFSSTPSIVYLPPSSLVSHGAILSARPEAAVAYPRGTAHQLGLNPYLVDVAHAPRTAYISEEGEGEDEEKSGKKELLAGEKLGLVSVMQNRENVRIGFAGSPEMFANKWWKDTAAGNKEFIDDLAKWVFQETGVVRVVETSHHRAGEDTPRDVYRIKDDLTYSIELTQHVTDSAGNSSWAPFIASDIQMDFTMLDPHVRKGLKQVATGPQSATYETSFVAPDRHGVFKFVVEYWRPGWSYIRASSTASVVPFRHDEYPRFILGAWPFYSSALSASIAFLLFCGLWVALGESDRGKKKAE